MATVAPMKPRLVAIHKKGRPSFGFNLHGLKGKPGQTVKSVDENGAAFEAGVLAGDRIMGVNGESVVGETHTMVVERIRTAKEVVTILLIDEHSFDFHNARGIPIVPENAVRLSNEDGPVARDKILVDLPVARKPSTTSPPLSPTGPPGSTGTHAFTKKKVSKRDEAKKTKSDWAARMAAFDNL